MIEKGEPCYPDYEESIMNLSCSIQNYYGIEPLHKTLPQVDEILSHNHKHVVVILLDGLGMNILEDNLTYHDFLRRHLLTDYSSVFPPTTVASTTSFLSGKSPIEHGWLGWDVHFEQENKTITCFHNTLQGTTEQAAEYNIPRKYLPYKNIVEQINEAGTAKANLIFPFGPEAHSELYDWIGAIKKSISQEGKTFTYAYWENPDHLLHQLGNKDRDVEKVIRDINAALVELCENAKDTVFFITADHGHTAIQNVFLEEDYPNIFNMLERQTSIEPRAISFYVKPEYKDVFADEFNKYFGNDYVLYTKEQILKEQLFGDGEPNKNLTGIGDFVAAGISHKTILWNKKQKKFRSHHAGLTKEEMRIPLIWYETKPKKPFLFWYYTVVGIVIFFLIYILMQ